MPTSRGRAEVKAFIADLPVQVDKLLRGAGRAGGRVIADEAKERCTSDEVEIVLRSRKAEQLGHVVVTITVKEGFGRSIGTWLEYGTDPHVITVDAAHSGGMTARRINRLDRDAAREGRSGPGSTLVINGKPVGTTVLHPGARAHPFLRPALDTKEAEAIAAAQSYIDARVKPSGIVGTADGEGDEA